MSERTARRDLDALAMSGVPVYSVQGRGGGWRLIGGASTDLTGLRSPEARALMTMAAVSGESSPEFRTAMAKLVQALPEPMRREAEAVAAATLRDERPWGAPAASGSRLAARSPAAAQPGATRSGEESDVGPSGRERWAWLVPLQEAVLAHRVLMLGYARPGREATNRRIEPLGLVHKRSSWYVVADTEAGRRTFRVDRVTSIENTGERFEPPAAFDLEAAWTEMTDGYIERGGRAIVEAIVDDEILAPLRTVGLVVTFVGPADPRPGTNAGRSRVTLASWNTTALAAQVAGFVGSLELIDPPEDLCAALAATGRALVERFS